MTDQRPSDSAPDSSPARERQPAPIKPVKKKIGEDRDNLRRREKWYRRRAGDGPPARST